MKRTFTLFSFVLILSLVACSPAPEAKSSVDPSALRFSGERALAIEAEFVQSFPNRSSGQPNNHLAAVWLRDEFSRMGLTCTIDQWQVVNYSQPAQLQNVVCRLPGRSEREIVLAAHLDQSSLTVQGADNDGSGIAIMMHLAEIFSTGETPARTLVFLATDAEEWGELGAVRFVQTHPDKSQIIAGISLDNLGYDFYNGLDIDQRGQFRGYGPLWIQRLAQESARAAGDLWVPGIVPPTDQVLSQAVPISFVDNGPMIAAGIPAINLGGHIPPEAAEQYWSYYHSPEDTLEHQSAASLQQAGRVTEALVRQLLSMERFPGESGPYLYFEATQQVVNGLPLWVLFGIFVALFFAGAVLIGRKDFRRGWKGWRDPLVHWLGLWLPLLGSILLLYLFVETGLMDKYALYPASTKDPATYTPKWTAVVLWLAGLVILLWLGRRLAGRFMQAGTTGSWRVIKSLAFLVIGLGGVYIASTNPFSLLFILPLLFWLLISGRRGVGKALDLVFFLLGGLVVYVLFYFFGALALHIDFAILWFMMMMFSIQMISFPAAAVITAILAAGLTLVVNPPEVR